MNAQPNITPATPKPVFTKLAALFHIEPGEGRVLAALFALAGSIGFARVLVQTASSAIFLATYDIAILPWVYIGSALAVPVMGYLYEAIEKRLSFERLQTLNLGAQVLVIAALWLSLTLTTSSLPALVLLAWYEVLWSMTTIGLFSTIIRLLNLRQAKRLLGLIGAGDVIAATLGGFLAAPWAGTFGTVSMLPGSVVALCLRDCGRTIDLAAPRSGRTVRTDERPCRCRARHHRGVVAPAARTDEDGSIDEWERINA